MTETLRAAIIGPGRIASTYDDEVTHPKPASFFQGEHRHAGLYTIHPINHANAYLTTPGYELVAVAGRGKERLDAFAQRWGVTPYANAEQMLAEAKPDVVSICTQSAEKAALTIAAAKAGVKAIIVEKAMATSVAEADAMIAACDEAGALLVIDHPWRFSPMAREAKRRLDDGEIGALGTVAGWSRGGMLHGGTHTLDMLRFFGGDITEVVAWGPVADEWTDRNADGMVRFASGITGFFALAHDAFAGFDLRGSSGQISFSTAVGDASIVRAELLEPASKRAYPLTSTREPIADAVIDMSTTQRVIAETRDALLDGGPIISSGRDGAATLEACIAALISAKEGRAIKLPLADADRAVVIPNR
jgi:predicted dehydrogenase